MKTTGNRKLYLGIAYLIACVFLGWLYINHGNPLDLVGLGAVFTGLATGVGAVVWGNTKEHQHSNPKEDPK